MAILDLINSLGSRDIAMLFGIVIIIVLLIMNYCKVNKIISSDNKDRDNFVRDNETHIEKLDAVISNNNKVTVILYYTEWCGYSKMFMPEWKLVKEQINNGKLKDLVTFEEYDCDTSKEKCYGDGINGYPSITLRKQDGTIINYPNNFPRKTELVIDFITKNITAS